MKQSRGAVSLASLCALALTACAGARAQDGTPAEAGESAGSGCPSCYQEGLNERESGDPVRALSVFERGCSERDGPSCDAAGRMYADGQGVPKDGARAVSLLVRACELGHWQACADIGTTLVQGRAGPERATEGRELLARGCEGGHAISCSDLALASQRGDGGPVDPATSARMYGRSCELGYAPACTLYGMAFARGEGVTADGSRARELFDQACQARHPSGCGNLGVALRDGVGGPVDMTRAVSSFERGCAGGHATACSNLGVAFLRGLGGLEADPERAVSLFEVACKGGNQVACKNLEAAKASASTPEEAAAPRWTTSIGSLTIGSGDQTATFKDVRSTCSAIPLSLAFGAAAADVRECLSGSDTRRVSVAVRGGRLASSSVAPDDAAGRCVTSALGRAPLGDLSCAFEATVSR
jgi:TPR repeat protein